jgi:hypothetical protein
MNAVCSETHTKHTNTMRGHKVVFVSVETGSMLSGVINSWSHNYIPPYPSMVWYLIKHTENFAFYSFWYKISVNEIA